MCRVRTISRKTVHPSHTASLGSFLSGFALGEGSFMIVWSKRATIDEASSSQCFNVRSTTACAGSLSETSTRKLRRAGNAVGIGGSIAFRSPDRIVPSSSVSESWGRRQRTIGYGSAVLVLVAVSERPDYAKVLALRERMNRGRKETLSGWTNPQNYTPAAIRRYRDDIVAS